MLVSEVQCNADCAGPSQTQDFNKHSESEKEERRAERTDLEKLTGLSSRSLDSLLHAYC